MEYSLLALNKYVKIDDIDPLDLCKKITSVGLEVEGLRNLSTGDKVVVGYVHSRVDHPDSDHLNVCQVEVAPGVKQQIVCGAPNVDANQKVLVALPGCDLGNGFIIKESVIRGEASNGMICSLNELGIDSKNLRKDQVDGIEVLDNDAPIGEDGLAYLGLRDTIIDIGLTPNRVDCMSLVNLAYEIGAILGREVTVSEGKVDVSIDSDIEISNETDLCEFFSGRVIKGIQVKESPQWLKNTLVASGVKPINHVVDLGNFVMLETGQPVHMYDYDKLSNKKFVIKTGIEETKTLLDSNEYEIKSEDIVIMAGNTIGCIAGVMGSDDTKIDDNTSNIVIEAATFDNTAIRNSARRLNINSDASSRYSKAAIDTSKSLYVQDRLASLLVEFQPELKVGNVVSTKFEVKETIVSVTTSKVNGLLGTNIDTATISDIFTSLKFDFKLDGDEFTVQVPSYRKDITMSADLIEEVARMYGYDTLPSTLPAMSMTQGGYQGIQDKIYTIKDSLKDLGLQESVTYTLTSPTLVNDFNLFHGDNENVTLSYPLGEERSVTRKSVISSMLQVIQYNKSHNNQNVGLFEISNTYSVNTEISTLSIACTGIANEVPHCKVKQPYDFYVVKGYVENLFKCLGLEPSRYSFVRVDSNQTDYHPGRSANVIVQGKTVGVVGQIHPVMEKKYDVKNVYVVQLNLTNILELQTKGIQVQPISMYPVVYRDLAFVVDESVAGYDMIRSMIKASKKLVKDARIFDIYQGEHVETGKKSMAISLAFQDETKTLEDAEISSCIDNIIQAIEKEFNAILRG